MPKRPNSWKTTSAGITVAASSAVGLYMSLKGEHPDANAVTASISGILAGIGFLFTQDHKPVTNENEPVTSTASK